MLTIIVLCEGKTEVEFVNKIIYNELFPKGIYVQPRLIPTSTKSSGGALNKQRIFYYLRDALRERRNTYVTTFFDLYCLPRDFPGLQSVDTIRDPVDRVVKIEEAFHQAVISEIGCRPDRFLPYIQPYEFEALLFSDPKCFSRIEPRWKKFDDSLVSIRHKFSSPEHINNGIHSHPSARLRKLLDPEYKKVEHGSKISARIGIIRIRSECKHFDLWLNNIENLSELE
ncbi:MAG: DUF4276 family protein [Bacteroidetes bacterium]|nr:DUF4276 family protein [Bacteroidota bacterium]